MAGNTKNLFVVDASFVLAFLLDEGNNEVENIFERHAKGEREFIAPHLLKYEVGNGLRSKIYRKKINARKGRRLYGNFFELKIIEKEFDYLETLSLATSKKLSFYDAAYVYLAKQYKTKLFTLDKILQKI